MPNPSVRGNPGTANEIANKGYVDSAAKITIVYSGSWPSRSSSIPAGYSGAVIYDSRADATATTPTDMVSGDVWAQASPSLTLKQKMVAWFTAIANATTLTAIVGIVLTAVGTATAAAVAATNIHTYQRRVNFLVTVASTSAVSGWREANANYAVARGFIFVCRFGPPTGSAANSTRRWFVGFTSTTAAPTDVNPSGIADCLGVGADSGDTNLQFMHRTASGTVVKSDTGMSKSASDATEMWEVTITCAPGATTATISIKRLSDGTVASYTTTTAIPASTTLLAIRGWTSVGGTNSVSGFSLCSIYTEVA